MPDPRIHQASKLLAEARRINDDEHKTADDARRAHQLVRDANALRRAVELDAEIKSGEDWLSQPDYKHDMVGAGLGGSLGVPGGGFDRETKSQGFGGGGEFAPADQALATKQFFEWIKKGDRASPEAKASIVEDATGDVLVPIDYAATIVKAVSREGRIRQRAFVRQTTSDRVQIGNVSVSTPQWGRLEVIGSTTDALGAPGSDLIYVDELSAMAKIGTDEVQDSPDLEAIIRQAVAAKFAETEDDAYAFGAGGTQAGNAKPYGFAYRATAAGGPTVTQGITAAANATVTADNLRALPFQVPSAFRNSRAAYYASDDAAAAIALLKSTGSQDYLQPDPNTLLGFPFVTVSGMPSMATTGTATDPSVMFGDMWSAYLITDNGGFSVQVLRERYADQGLLGMLFKRRTGGDVVRPTALARLLL